MIIRKSNKQYTLYRYGGSAAGKNIEVRIGAVAIGTRPAHIPDDLVMDLTPRELTELRERLTADERDQLSEKIGGLEVDLKRILDAVNTGLLDEQSTAKLNEVVKALTKALPRARPRASVAESATTTESPTTAQP